MKIQASITIPYAVANYADLRDRGFYYVDKTDYIPRLEAYNAPVFLRPRRFGKSLLVSTLAHYYDRTLAHRFEDLFGGTYIGSHPTPEHNRYMIIRYDFSAMVMADNMEGLEQNFNILNRGPVEIMVTHNRDLFGDFQFSTRENATQMLEEVLAYARAHDLPPVYILIDEYDNFTNQLLTSYNDPLYEKVTTADSFLRTFFKVIKKGIGEGSIRTCFCTGVLPVTMDDLTSGYNIAEILTLESDFINMLGFTHAEADAYLRYVLDKYTGSQERYDEIWQLIVNNYDGYRFSPKGEKLFNATILTYFLKKFAVNKGEVPEEMIDENLRTDIGWLRRLTLSLENSKAMLDALVIDNGLYYNVADLSSKFNKQKFFDKNFYPVSLFYLGMTTLFNDYRMMLPNLTMRSIYMDYYNVLNRIDGGAMRYAPVYERFTQERDFESLVRNYFEQYLGQFPAQVFDKINENFIRCSFFELVSRYLSSCYTFAIEQNNSEGRADFEMTGIPGTDYYTDDRLVEFKYYKAKEAEKMLGPDAPLPEHVEQVHRYAEDTLRHFPNYKVRTYVVYICANRGWKCWEV
ncbi:ATP-binding protein [Bacteroides salyersiae]|nr:ATP-binding protein [Bacteroides salyersiae]KAA3717009.1 ATP-binding protein [Bacteroides salyersiae]KAA3746130.1 ATP-binding protein [Bacteroides salyersiae]KAA3761292.1 ATP-binding protein [Bacteroides salyersiae]KAB5338453.1 ATP-binding protein [Bacteroides salyersiae]KAB5371441.1 ATP-binding protein [Bacteroides salyersiae]